MRPLERPHRSGILGAQEPRIDDSQAVLLPLSQLRISLAIHTAVVYPGSSSCSGPTGVATRDRGRDSDHIAVGWPRG